MTRYLLDTNILLRSCDITSSSFTLAVQSVAHLLSQNHECVLAPQVLIEFWVVATRPIEVNGLGWSSSQTRDEIEQLLNQFPLLEETPEVFTNCLKLVTTFGIKGKRIHDIRLLALMQVHLVIHLLTFNRDDFPPITSIVIMSPQEVMLL